MLLRPEYLSQELDRPLPTKDGGILRTIRDACNYMTGIGKQRELRSQEVAGLQIDPCKRGCADRQQGA
jgi:hypothetical protein